MSSPCPQRNRSRPPGVPAPAPAVRLTVAVTAASPDSPPSDEAVELALARWGIAHGSVLDRRSPPLIGSRPRPGSSPASGPEAGSTAGALREIRQHVAAARRRAADEGHRDLLLLPGEDDLISPEWAEAVVRICPHDSFRTDLGSVARDLGRTRNDVFRELATTDAASFTRLVRAGRAVLVEGKTDRAVFEVLVRRFGLDETIVVATGSKVRLAALNLVAEGLGVRTYVIFDGDGGQVQAGPARAHRVIRTRRVQTENLLRGLAPQDAQWEFGDPGTAGSRWCAFTADLETQLSTWPSFMAALTPAGGGLAAKDHRALRAAAAQADLEDMPPILHRLRTALTRVGEDREED